LKITHYTRLLCLSILSTWAYVGLEWLFFVTKPSFFDGVKLSQQLESLWLTDSIYSVAIVTSMTAVFLILLLIRAGHLAAIVPSFVIACTALILLDNFTYSTLRYGIVNVPRLLYPLYCLFFLYSGYRAYRYLSRLVLSTQSTLTAKPVVTITCHLALIGNILYLAQAFSDSKPELGTLVKEAISSKRPHIIALSSDGISSKYMSIYGFAKKTTPFLKSIEDRLYIFENHLPNCMNTHCSFASIYSGKLTSTHRIHHNTEFFTGKAAKEHLPGILKRHGYRTYNIELGSVGSPDKLNLQDAFDEIYTPQSKLAKKERTSFPVFQQNPAAKFFLESVTERIFERLMQIVNYQDMRDEFGELTDRNTLRSPTAGNSHNKDGKSTELITSIIESADSPVFIQTHLLGTHGPYFYLEQQHFSKGKEQDPGNNDDYYFDALREFDRYVEQVIKSVEKNGDNTIVVIFSDHGRHSSVEPRGKQRIPLMFYLPNGLSGRVEANAHVVDIAPTILDLVDIPTPDWMEGVSLVRKRNLKKDRMLMSTYSRTPIEKDKDKSIEERMYTFMVFVCDTLHDLRIPELEHYRVSHINAHVGSCQGVEQPSKEQIRKKFMNIIKEKGYKLESLVSKENIKRYCIEDPNFPRELCS
jgi:arylsulfatase A-like enzyme